MLRKLLDKLTARAETLVSSLSVGEAELAQAETQLDLGDTDAAAALLDAAQAAGARGARLDVARARVAFLRGDLTAAAELLDEVLLYEPRHADALAFRAAVWMSAGRPDEALAHAERAIAGGYGKAWLRVMMGVGFLHSGREPEAVAAWETALRIEPDNVQALANLVLVHVRAERWAEADTRLTRLEGLTPVTPELLHTRAAVRFHLGDEDGAWPLFAEALAGGGDFEGHERHGTALYRSGRAAEAQAAYAKALELNPQDADAAFSKSLVDLVIDGYSAERWRAMDTRFRRHREYEVRTRLWDGNPLPAGSTLLAYHDQGVGDILMIARYLPALARHARGPVLVGALEPARRLLRMSAERYADDWRGITLLDEPRPWPNAVAYDVEIPVPSIVAPLDAGVHRAQRAYLGADDALLATWAERLGPRDGRRRVGLVWAGNPARKDDALRSVPTALLAALGGPEIDARIQWVNLQMDARPEHKAVPLPLPHLDPRAQITDFADTAAIMQQLDLVISIDTAAAHLAGALAVPCWVLLSRMLDWRWEMGGVDQPWYAQHRSFRVARNREWQPVLEQVRAELLAWAG